MPGGHKKRDSNLPAGLLSSVPVSPPRKRPWYIPVALAALVFFFVVSRQVQRPAAAHPKDLLLAAKPKRQARTAFVCLTDPREDHYANVIPMLKHVERKYGWTGHPYFIFIDKALPGEDVLNATRDVTNGKATWQLLDASVGWGPPDWINDDVLNLAIPPEWRPFFPVGYHNMCRFFAGFAYSHPVLKPFDYFWRLDSNVEYPCTPPYDPAQYMIDRDLDYGFIAAISDAAETLEGFGELLKRFISLDSTKKLLAPNSNNWHYLFTDGEYNFRTFYNNFEIISRRFFESEAYRSWFDFVDRNSTGIYSRRYGDAPIRTAGVSLFLEPEKVAWFGRQIGYVHEWGLTVPEEPWKTLFCEDLPSPDFKVPYTSTAGWYGFDQPVEPPFDPSWLLNDRLVFRG